MTTQQQNNNGGVEGRCFSSLLQIRGWIPQGQSIPETDLRAVEHPTLLKLLLSQLSSKKHFFNWLKHNADNWIFLEGM